MWQRKGVHTILFNYCLIDERCNIFYFLILEKSWAELNMLIACFFMSNYYRFLDYLKLILLDIHKLFQNNIKKSSFFLSVLGMNTNLYYIFTLPRPKIGNSHIFSLSLLVFLHKLLFFKIIYFSFSIWYCRTFQNIFWLLAHSLRYELQIFSPRLLLIIFAFLKHFNATPTTLDS